MHYQFHYQTPIGKICIEENDNFIVALNIIDTIGGKTEDCDFEHCETKLLKEAGRQLLEYFDGTRKTFHLPLKLDGTEFQKKVWNALGEIPYGETRSYGGIAKAVGSPKASRAVGGANHNNPIMIFVPCHRVIGANGSLVGFGGGLPAKEYLLELERNLI